MRDDNSSIYRGDFSPYALHFSDTFRFDQCCPGEDFLRSGTEDEIEDSIGINDETVGILKYDLSRKLNGAGRLVS